MIISLSLTNKCRLGLPYGRCVKEVIRREFQQKADFIAQHPQFRHWAPKYRKQLTMALEKVTTPFEHVLCRQGSPVEAIYYIVASVFFAVVKVQ